jgi:hypothetical protein
LFVRDTNPPNGPDIPTTPTTIFILLILRIFTALNPFSHAQLLRFFFLPITIPVFVLALVLSDIAFAGLTVPFAGFFWD